MLVLHECKRHANIVIVVKIYYKRKSQNRKSAVLETTYFLHKNATRHFSIAKVALLES